MLYALKSNINKFTEGAINMAKDINLRKASCGYEFDFESWCCSFYFPHRPV